MTKRLLILPAVLVVVVLAGGSVAQAHVLRQDNGIAVELHMPPDDKPVAKKSTKLLFTFESVGDTFKLQNCNCKVAVVQTGKSLQQVTVRQAPDLAADEGIAYIEFPDGGDYEVVLTGTATDNSFGNFSLKYPAHVAPPVSQPTSVVVAVAIIAGSSLLVLGFVAYSIVAYRKQKE